jgi:4-amino-4-deoxy-L-arabinose transferase-like glycosyltransferase
MDAAPPPTPADRAAAYWRTNVRWRPASVAAAGALALGLAFRLGALRLPLDRDEGAYGTLARGWLDGLVPYRDLFDHKPPVIYGFYALATSLHVDEVLAVRALSALLFAASLVLVFAIGRRVYGERAGALAALAFALIGNDFTLEAVRANTEQVMLPSLLASLYCALRADNGDRRLRWLFLCGAASGLAVLTKPVAVWPLLVLALHVSFMNQRPGGAKVPTLSPASSLLPPASVAAGASLPLAICTTYFAANGALDDFYASVVTFNSEYVRYFWDNGYRGQITDLSPLASPYAMLAFAAAFAGFALPSTHRRGHALIVAWAAANLIGAKMGIRTFGHYFVPLLPGIALLSAAFVEVLIQTVRANGAPRWQRYTPVAAAVILAAGWQARENVRFYFLDSPEEQVRREFGAQGELSFAQADAVAGYVRSVTSPHDEILVLGMEPEVYYLSDRKPASRYLYALTLAFAETSLQTVREDFAARTPKLVVSPRGDGTLTPGELAARGYVRTYVAGWLEVYEPASAVDARESEVAAAEIAP